MSKGALTNQVSVIVPTIGRPDSLRKMLDSLCIQTVTVHEVIVADGSATNDTASVTGDPCWSKAALNVKRIAVRPPHAVRQRQAAIIAASGDLLLMLDDDVVLEPDCVEQMARLLSQHTGVVGVIADFKNQTWPMPTRAWRFYLRHVLRMEEGAWQGRVVGPLLRFGYNPPPLEPKPMDWLGTCNTMIRRSAYEEVGGFSNFFLHRCTTNEDVDLGLKLSRIGVLLLCPLARLGHFHAPAGRVPMSVAAEDDLFNRYLVLRRTCGRPIAVAFPLVLSYFLIETISNLAGCARRLRANGFGSRLLGRVRALCRILGSITSKCQNIQSTP
jgi:GT2 family glycosyltransferase